MPHILALINIIGGLMFCMAAIDFISGYPRHHLSAGFWGAVGVVLVYNSFRLWP